MALSINCVSQQNKTKQEQFSWWGADAVNCKLLFGKSFSRSNEWHLQSFTSHKRAYHGKREPDSRTAIIYADSIDFVCPTMICSRELFSRLCVRYSVLFPHVVATSYALRRLDPMRAKERKYSPKFFALFWKLRRSWALSGTVR